jgi:hypothetical protein
LHRVGGPAIEYYNGEKKYYIQGEKQWLIGKISISI